QLLATVTVVTPNVPEARLLCDLPDADPRQLARAVRALGPDVAVVTGGHAEAASDHYCDGGEVIEIEGARHPDGAAHGSGCTHSAVLAGRLAHRDSPLQAARIARAIAGDAVRDGLRFLGAGAGPVDVLGLARPSE
ncbi:MAG TPA: bifunctional hydroxymethylpyrimidine kinase/phosphomethylpyrimidine kinase, partial [Solirubrobacteraceae bacterium]|nr:bifunctional hydroxymethylpyrimidine kinase/phosphomethylpyrimidine kinase [Solirubrobacteraceae bacterium]